MFIFYRGTDLVHGKLWHWVVAFLITLLVVLITCMGIARLELVEFIVDPGNNPHINAFIFEYGIVSMLISIIPAFAGILFKFISINNKYNPF
jgi:hypothetical protein